MSNDIFTKMKYLFSQLVFVYICYTTVYGARVVDNSITVETVNYDEEGYLKVGEHKTISCKASNRNQQVEWVDPNGNVVKRIPGSRVFAQEHFVQSFRGRAPALVLTITKALVQDTGIYYCRSGKSVKNVSLCVIEPSDFVDTRTEVTADIGRSITLSCQAKGEPEPRLLWNRNGETITDLSIYQPIKSLAVRRFSPYWPRWVGGLAIAVVARTGDAAAHHRPVGFGYAIYSYTATKDEDSSTKYRVMTKYNIQGFEGLLTITSLEPDDSGVYSCVSIQESPQNEDCSHLKTMNITLNINYAPLFENGNDTKFVYGRTNEEVGIKCKANAYPTATYRWFRDVGGDTLYEFDKKQVVFSEEENEAVLTVVAGPTSFGQRFKCLATNDLGETEKYFTLLKMEKPRRPTEVNYYNSTEDAIQLNVTWDGEALFPVDAFDIQYIQDQREPNNRVFAPKEPAWRKSRQTQSKLEQEEFEDSNIEGILIELPDLEQEADYWVRVRAINEAGESPWSDPVFASTATKSEEVTTTEEPIEASASNSDIDTNDSMFYGIFFAGGILVVAVVCMFAMRMVK